MEQKKFIISHEKICIKKYANYANSRRSKAAKQRLSPEADRAPVGASWEQHHLQKRKKVLAQEIEEILSLSWGCPSPAPLPDPPSLRGFYALHPHPRPGSFLSPPPSFLHHRVTPGPDIPCSGSGLEPVRNQSASFTQVRILPEGVLKDQGSGPRRRGLAS